FLLNNYGLLIVMFFVLVFTTFPMVSEAFWKEKVTVGPPIYNAFLQPLGLGAIALHFLLGKVVGYPAVVWSPPVYGGVMGKGLQAFNAITPVLGFSLAMFNIAVIVQEFSLLYRSRIK